MYEYACTLSNDRPGRVNAPDLFGIPYPLLVFAEPNRP
ncbi:hypothetical protein GGR92_004056 [Spirosoma lacussanchae]